MDASCVLGSDSADASGPQTRLAPPILEKLVRLDIADLTIGRELGFGAFARGRRVRRLDPQIQVVTIASLSRSCAASLLCSLQSVPPAAGGRCPKVPPTSLRTGPFGVTALSERGRTHVQMQAQVSVIIPATGCRAETQCIVAVLKVMSGRTNGRRHTSQSRHGKHRSPRFGACPYMALCGWAVSMQPREQVQMSENGVLFWQKA